MSFKHRKLSEIHPHPNNPRYIEDGDMDTLVTSISSNPDYFEARPIILSNRTGQNVILAGNQRFQAAKIIGLKTVPTYLIEGLTEEREREIIIRDNVSNGKWDYDILANEYPTTDLIEWGLELPLDYQFDPNIEPEEDNYEIPDEIKTDIVLGDLFEIGEHRLLCGDSTKTEDVERLMNGQKADMVFTDPPYGINEKGERSKRFGVAKGNKLPDFKDDTIQYAIDAFNQPINQYIPVQVWFGANYYCHSLPQTSNWLVWDKRVEDNQRDNNSDCELAWVKSQFNSIRIFRHLWKGMLKDSQKGVKRVHATQKPIALVNFCINEYGIESQIILDYFGGSGITMLASEQLKKVCYMLEIETFNCQVIVDRMSKNFPDLPILKNGKPYQPQ